jgi:hypothetical protein
MLRNIAAETEDEGIVQLASSGVSRSDDGTVDVYLHPEEESRRDAGVRLTEDDALALVDALRQAAKSVAKSDPQTFIRLFIR